MIFSSPNYSDTRIQLNWLVFRPFGFSFSYAAISNCLKVLKFSTINWFDSCLKKFESKAIVANNKKHKSWLLPLIAQAKCGGGLKIPPSKYALYTNRALAIAFFPILCITSRSPPIKYVFVFGSCILCCYFI